MNKLPARMRRLARDPQGRPVPWFAWWDAEGVPHVTIIDQQRKRTSIQRGLCQICGQRTSVYKAFVLGPIQVETRTTTEGPAHPGCARYALAVCPFLANPSRERHDINSYNPGVFALWICRDYEIGVLPEGRDAILVGDPVSICWWEAGHPCE